MIYRDYSRKAGEWIPNIHGGRENLEALAFLRRVNEVIYATCPGAITVAEDSIRARVLVASKWFSVRSARTRPISKNSGLPPC